MRPVAAKAEHCGSARVTGYAEVIPPIRAITSGCRRHARNVAEAVVAKARRSPWTGIFVCYAITLVFGIVYPGWFFLFSVAAFAWISTYVLVVAAAIWLRRKDKQTPRPFRMPLFPFLPAVGLIGMVLVLFFSGRDTLLVGGGLFVSCLIYSLVVLSLRARRVQQ